MKPFLTEQEESHLCTLHRSQKLRRHADRIKTILFLNQGFTFAETAHLLMLDEDTVKLYYKEYCQGGLNKLLTDEYQGKMSQLTKTQERELTLYLEKHTLQTVAEISAHIGKIYQVKYTLSGATRLLHRLGFVYKKRKTCPRKSRQTETRAIPEGVPEA